MKLAVDSLEKDRDFYFGKLREVEILAQQTEKSPFVEQVLAILYALFFSFSVLIGKTLDTPRMTTKILYQQMNKQSKTSNYALFLTYLYK